MLQHLKKVRFLPGCLFASTTLPLPGVLAERVPARKRWISEIATILNDADLLFLDPDNGIEPHRFRPQRKAAVKSVTFDDIASLKRKNRTLIVYHHQTRRKGGHFAEIEYQVERFHSHGYKRVDVLRAKPYSPSHIFFIRRKQYYSAASREVGDALGRALKLAPIIRRICMRRIVRRS